MRAVIQKDLTGAPSTVHHQWDSVNSTRSSDVRVTSVTVSNYSKFMQTNTRIRSDIL